MHELGLDGIKIEHHWFHEMPEAPASALAAFLHDLGTWERPHSSLAFLARSVRSLPLKSALRFHALLIEQNWLRDLDQLGRLPEDLLAYLLRRAVD
jgi:hypothetical protein